MGMPTTSRPGRARAVLLPLLPLVVALAAVAVGAPPADAQGEAPATGGFQLETFELPSPLVDPAAPGGWLEDRRPAPKVHVLLPEGYADHPERQYPVLWLLHGANGGTDTWLPDVTDHLAGLPAVVVMPDGGLFGMYMDWWNGGARGGPSWATFHLDVLRRTIHERYRILPGRRWHAIAGISMGGQGALRYAAMLPGYFGSVVGFSAAFPDIQAAEVLVGMDVVAAAAGYEGASHQAIYGPVLGPYAAGNSPKALAPNLAHTRMFLTSGSGLHCPQDPVNPGGIVLDTITELGINNQQGPFAAAAHTYGADVTVRTTCGSHTFGVWDRAFPVARAWGFFGEVPEAPEQWVYRSVATTGELWGLPFSFTAPPPAVARFERIGLLLVGTGIGEVVLGDGTGCGRRVTLPFVTLLSGSCFGTA